MNEEFFEAEFQVATPRSIAAVAGCEGDTYLVGHRAYILFPSVDSQTDIETIIDKVAAEVTNDVRGFQINFESSARETAFGVMMPRQQFCTLFSVFKLT